MYVYTRMCTHALDLCAYASCMHTHTCMGMRVHAMVLEVIKDKFFLHLKLSLKRISHRLWAIPIPHFFYYKKSYMVHVQNTLKILRKNIRFTRNNESKREFFTKHSQVNIFLIDAFSSLDIRVSSLLITSLFNCK